ncbi:MAG: WecB/TagA/CpsF family glycosyltransferase [Oscillospiraceae bacterium]|jgi:N-acetylglucosaminyldiphosphoundecaprenol N-acetyl-beta-D-mannosaminyltransferase|nr:WecB/TagA/CpsF family glycosyltransferase [Oscillospiraceae bacterium]
MNKITILGIGFDALSFPQALGRCTELVRSGGYAVTPNPEILMAARGNGELKRALDGAALTVADGAGVVLASKLLKTPLPAKLPGIELAEALIAELAKSSGRVYLFGAKPGVAELAAEKLTAKYPGLIICGCSGGYGYDEDAVMRGIRASQPNLVLVCLGSPKQELFMEKLKPEGYLAIGLGGSLDVFSGTSKRAPEFWRKLNLEWLWRIVTLKRFGRLLTILKFVLIILFRRKET